MLPQGKTKRVEEDRPSDSDAFILIPQEILTEKKQEIRKKLKCSDLDLSKPMCVTIPVIQARHANHQPVTVCNKEKTALQDKIFSQDTSIQEDQHQWETQTPHDGATQERTNNELCSASPELFSGRSNSSIMCVASSGGLPITVKEKTTSTALSKRIESGTKFSPETPIEKVSTQNQRQKEIDELNIAGSLLQADSMDLKLELKECPRIFDLEPDFVVKSLPVLITRTYPPVVKALVRRPPFGEMEVFLSQARFDCITERERQHFERNRKKQTEFCTLELERKLFPSNMYSLANLENTIDFSSEPIKSEVIAMMFYESEENQQKILDLIPLDMRDEITRRFRERKQAIERMTQDYVRKIEDDKRKVCSSRAVTAASCVQLNENYELIPGTQSTLMVFGTVDFEEDCVFRLENFVVKIEGDNKLLVSCRNFRMDKMESFHGKNGETIRKTLTISSLNIAKRQSNILHGRVDLIAKLIWIEPPKYPNVMQDYVLTFKDEHGEVFLVTLDGSPNENAIAEILQAGNQVFIKNLNLDSHERQFGADHLTLFMMSTMNHENSQIGQC